MLKSSQFTEDDVLQGNTRSEAALVAASFLCSNVLDAVALEFGKPEILSWYVHPSNLVVDRYTSEMWGEYRIVTAIEDTAFEREKFAVTVCPATRGFHAVLKYANALEVYDYIVAHPDINADSLILDTDMNLRIFTVLGKGRFYLNLNDPPVFDVSTLPDISTLPPSVVDDNTESGLYE